MKTKITEVELLTSNVIRTRPMYQWDTGQILKITDTTFPDGTAVQFGNETMRCVLETYMQDNQVTIPAEALRQRRDLTAYIVTEDESSDTTVYEILIPVIPKPKPEDYAGEPEVQRIVKIINQTADKVQALAEAAETSATDAADSAASAEASKNALESGLQELYEVKTGVVQNTKEIQKTSRSLDALWKLNNGISYQYETDAETAYQKTVPSGAKLCGLSKIGGRTLVWNQIIDYTTLKNGTFDGNKFTSDKPIGHYSYMYLTFNQIAGHKYYFKICNAYYIPTEGTESSSDDLPKIMTYSDIELLFSSVKLSETPRDYGIFSNIATVDGTNRLELRHSVYGFDRQTTIYAENIIGFDLTQMFGSGNEPATVEEFEAMFPEDYYPYNAGELMSFPMSEMVTRGKNLCPICTTPSKTDNGITFTNNGDGTISVSGTATDMASFGLLDVLEIPNEWKGEQLTFSFGTIENIVNTGIWLLDTNNEVVDTLGKGLRFCTINFADYPTACYVRWYVKRAENTEIVGTITPQIEFGTSVTDYAPYNADAIITRQTPQAILDLDGYGVGINDKVYNYVNKESKIYRKRIGAVDLGTLTWVQSNYGANTYETAYFPSNHAEPINTLNVNGWATTSVPFSNMPDKTLRGTTGNLSLLVIKDSAYTDVESFKAAMSGVILLYELAEEEIIDISDILDDEPFEVEAGGSLTFKNSNGDGYRVPIPTEEKYIISLAEVSGVTV